MELVWVSQKIRLIRERLQVSHAELATMLQVPELNIQAIEEGREELSSEMLLALVQRMNISADWLLFDRGEMHLPCLMRIESSPDGAATLPLAPTSEEQALDERIRDLEERIITETQLPLKQIRFLYARILHKPIEAAKAYEPQEKLPPAIRLHNMTFMDKKRYYSELSSRMKEGRQEFLKYFQKLVSLVCRHDT